MKLIGITGKTGSGKSTIGKLLSDKLNCKYIDIDKIGHEATSDSSISEKILKEFGYDILDKNKNIDRRKLGNIVFSNKDKMEILTNLTWNYMQDKLDNILSENEDYYILDWALLPTVKYWNTCDFKILITSNDIKRKNKTLKRDNISEEYFEKREHNTLNYFKFKFDYIFNNDYSEESLNLIINELYKKILKEDKE